MDIPASIFRAYDIRGVVGDTLTPAIVEQIGRALASLVLERGRDTVVIGRDGRLSGIALLNALADGLIAGGCDVIDVGLAPTPVVYFAAHHFGSQSCVAVTGSHNPPDYNGLKLVVDGETLHGETIQELRRRARAGVRSERMGKRREAPVLDVYRQRILGDVRLARPLKVAVDCGNGVAGIVAPDLIGGLGCDVKGLYCEVDGHFPHHHPNPSEPENLVDLIKLVTTQGFDLGLAFDGDGDRLGVVDGEGRVIWADRQMMLFARDVLSRHPGATILYDIKCSRHLGRQIAAHGGRPLMWRTGHSLMKAKQRETGALLAGEMSGHIFFQERWYGFDDALYAAARLLEILSQDARSPTEVFADLPDSLNTPELNVHFRHEGEHFEFMRRLLEHGGFEGAEVSTLDGLRADYEDGFGLVRPSNTTPSLVIRFEGDTPAALARIQSVFRHRLLAVEPTLRLPF
ncbi:MAG: phosphomannomutase/phosphoglucomutase [Chromatiales bacterium]|nr:phosphomannomutase/phosphoglucomutase [Chromatiales bacterium]